MPVSAICDFDILNSEQTLARLVESLGQEFQSVRPDCQLVQASIARAWSRQRMISFRLKNQVMAAEYKLALPDESDLIAEMEKTQRQFARRHKMPEMLHPPKAETKSASKRKKAVKKKKGSKASKRHFQ